MTRREFFESITIVAAAGVAAAKASPLRNLPAFRDLPASVWQNARWNGLVMIRPDPPAHLAREARIAQSEPGEPLVVSGTVFAPDGRTPAPGVTVYAYNTDAEGYYGANHADYPPRLHGWMLTDSSGRFELHTIRPGHYPDKHIPAHVHFCLWGSGYPAQWVEELRFAGDPYLTAEAGKDANVRPLSRASDGAWHCEYPMRASRESNFR